MLQVEGLVAGYGDVTVLHGLSLSVAEGQIVALLGANGAGKTTLMNTLSGLVRARAGSIRLKGAPIEDVSAERIVDLGVSHVPQGRRIFPGLSVYENLLVARTAATARAPGGFERALAQVHDLFPLLSERRDQLGWSLSGGEQQMLAVARALIARAKLILLDEPSLGLAPIIYRTMFNAIADVSRRERMTVLMVEQNAVEAMRIADFVYVMELGRIVAADRPEHLMANAEIEKAYLGV